MPLPAICLICDTSPFPFCYVPRCCLSCAPFLVGSHACSHYNSLVVYCVYGGSYIMKRFTRNQLVHADSSVLVRHVRRCFSQHVNPVVPCSREVLLFNAHLLLDVVYRRHVRRLSWDDKKPLFSMLFSVLYDLCSCPFALAALQRCADNLDPSFQCTVPIDRSLTRLTLYTSLSFLFLHFQDHPQCLNS